MSGGQMKDTQNVQLIDEYDEVMIKLIIAKYQESEGSRLWEEYQTALHNNELDEIPEILDIRCKKIIQSFL